MKISEAIVSGNPQHAGYAVLNEKTGEFRILTSPFKDRKWGDRISLKDVYYTIIEGVLYIKGVRLYYYDFRELFDRVDLWNFTHHLFTINESINSDLETPIVASDVYIKRWWRNNKKIKGIDLTQQEFDNYPDYFKSKDEIPCEYAISSFIVKE